MTQKVNANTVATALNSSSTLAQTSSAAKHPPQPTINTMALIRHASPSQHPASRDAGPSQSRTCVQSAVVFSQNLAPKIQQKHEKPMYAIVSRTTALHLDTMPHPNTLPLLLAPVNHLPLLHLLLLPLLLPRQQEEALRHLHLCPLHPLQHVW